MFQVCCWPPAS